MASSAQIPNVRDQANSINLIGVNSPKSAHFGRQPQHCLDDEGGKVNKDKRQIVWALL
jgi:hypothetical protein